MGNLCVPGATPHQAFYLVNSCICITSHSTHVGTGPRAPGILISRAHHENPYCSRHDPELSAWSFSSTSCDLFPESPSRLPVFYSPHPLQTLVSKVDRREGAAQLQRKPPSRSRLTRNGLAPGSAWMCGAWQAGAAPHVPGQRVICTRPQSIRGAGHAMPSPKARGQWCVGGDSRGLAIWGSCGTAESFSLGGILT